MHENWNDEIKTHLRKFILSHLHFYTYTHTHMYANKVIGSTHTHTWGEGNRKKIRHKQKQYRKGFY